MTSPTTAAPDISHHAAADKLMFGALAFAALWAAMIASRYGAMSLAVGGSAGLLLAGAAAFAAGRATLVSRLVLAACLAAMVMLHIQLGRGTVEFHFGVFVTLALLLVYRDWRPIVLAASCFAIHHVVFDRLQAAGLAVYCTPEADLMKMLMHAGYVVAQTSIEIVIALQLQRSTLESAEVARLWAEVQGNAGTSFDVQRVAVGTARAVRLKATLQRIEHVLGEVRIAAANIGTASAEIASGNQNLSSRTEKTASSLQQTASSMAQLTGTVKHSAESARQASQLASSAAEVAARGGTVVAQVVSTMDEINASSKRIADIIGTIDGIAFQTNILALNAAVEAARAGEQGRGFAVVASEVRSLAGRSAGAAREIKQLIGASVERVEAGARLVSDAGSTMREIVGSVQRVSDIIGDITAASAEQSDGIGHVNGAVVKLDEMTQQNAALVEQSAAAAESLKDQAQRLSTVIESFSLDHPTV